MDTNSIEREISFGRRAEELLVGAIDVHHHGYPEVSLDLHTRQSDVEELEQVRAAGMAGIVLKSHMWPSVGRAYHLNRLVPEIEVFPSITLNPIVGGFSPLAVESAARQGARVLFMPTWGAAHDRERKGMSHYLAKYLDHAGALTPETGMRVTDASGKVKPEVRECLAVAKQFGMAIATAHLSPEESLALTEKAVEIGIEGILFQHPDSSSVGASHEQMRDMAQMGALIELCALGLMPMFQRIEIGGLVEMLETAGPDKAVVTTDYFFDWVPSGPETLRMVIGALLTAGVPAETVRKLVNDTPRRFLGLPQFQPDQAVVHEG